MLEENLKKNSINDNYNKEDEDKSREDENQSYKDENIEVSMNGLKINKYYFPIWKQKIIPIHKIKDIKIIELDRSSGKYTFFGFSWKLYYYHLDRRRPLKDQAIIIDEEDNMIDIGITPDDVNQCFKVLKYLMKHMKNNKPFEPLFDESETQSLKSGKQKMD